MPRVRRSPSRKRTTYSQRGQSGGWLFSRKKNPWGDGRWAVSLRIAEAAPSKALHLAFNTIATSLGGLNLRIGPLKDTPKEIVLQYSFPDAFKATQFKDTLKAMNNLWYSTDKFLITNSEIVRVK